MKKGIAATLISVVVGFALFVIIIKAAGLENILKSVKGFSPIYFPLFLLVSFTISLAATYRWKAVLSDEKVNISLLTLLKYKLMVFGINYLTPAARLGGEPLKVFLLKSKRIKSPKAFASVVLDNFVGLGVDALLMGIVFIILFFIDTPLLGEIRKPFLILGLAAFCVVAAAYFVLAKTKKSIFSYILDAIGSFGAFRKRKFFAALREKVAKAEFHMREMLTKKPKKLWLAVLYASLSWPLTVLQYKLALLMLGINASLIQIMISVIAISLTAMIPIPAALGVQEAGQFSAFKLLSASPHTGIALSLVIRIKDLILLLISFMFISHEGINIFELINKKVAGMAGQDKRK